MESGDGGDVFKNGEIKQDTETVGGGKPHNNMPPYIVAHWIVRAY